MKSPYVTSRAAIESRCGYPGANEPPCEPNGDEVAYTMLPHALVHGRIDDRRDSLAAARPA